MGNSIGRQVVFVSTFTDGVLDPSQPMLGPLSDGGYIVAQTAPGCWGPMITPSIKGGHEVTQPVEVQGAEVGDAVLVQIESIKVTSLATASGVDQPVEGRFQKDPYVAPLCPECGTLNPETEVKGIGPGSIRCAKCGAEAIPFLMVNGYTIVFSPDFEVGVTLQEKGAVELAQNAEKAIFKPEKSKQTPVLILAPHDLVGVVARTRPFLGQLGTVPSIPFPDSHNAGDFGTFLVGAPHKYGLEEAQLESRTDGHMDIPWVGEGAMVICPVKVPGAGIYLGDLHALQGDGEIAGHTCDVSGIITLRVKVLKGLKTPGPILIPKIEDLPFLAKPLSQREKAHAQELAKSWGFDQIEESLPLSFVGTGGNLNEATENGLRRASAFLKMSVEEIKNRVTLTGAIRIGRLPGVVTVTFRVPTKKLAELNLLGVVEEQYQE
ncbi:MAG: acetamidase/formamidase family protein [Caldiserica bacterium]|jgi:formamidase|nr:acetamidase/formamidase family protein [Caldisericota bacterium]MDH7562707.1 acetamidase/formamidase family protein [Caldisericota bacterium]